MAEFGINIPGVSDYDGGNTFANLFRHFRGCNPLSSPYGTGMNVPVDSRGYPNQDFTGLAYTVDNRLGVVNGMHAIKFTGQATLGGSNVYFSNQHYDQDSNTTYADCDVQPSTTPGPGMIVGFNFTDTIKVYGGATNTGIADVEIQRPVARNARTAHPFGTLFSNQILGALAPFRCHRILDAVVTNNSYPDHWANDAGTPVPAGTAGAHFVPSNCSTWSTRRSPLDVLQSFGIGYAYEYHAALANANNNAALHFPIPIHADDDHVTKAAQTFLYGSDGVNPYTSPQSNPIFRPLVGPLIIESGNETWNDGFPPTYFLKVDDSGAAAANNPGLPWVTLDTNLRTMQYCGTQLVRIRDLFAAVYGEENYGVRFFPAFCGRADLQDSATPGFIAPGLDMIRQYDSRPLNRKTFYGGSGWYHTPPGQLAFEAANPHMGADPKQDPQATPYTYQSPDQLFATPPSTTFASVQAQYDLVTGYYGLPLLLYEGGESFGNQLFYGGLDYTKSTDTVSVLLSDEVLAGQSDVRIEPYVEGVINIVSPLAARAQIYCLCNALWMYAADTNDLTFPKFVAAARAIAANAGVDPAPTVAAFAPIDQPADPSAGAPALSTGYRSFAAGRYMLAYQATQAASGPGLGLYLDGAQVDVGSFSVAGNGAIPTVVRLYLTLDQPGDHIIDARFLQSLPGATGHFTFGLAPTIDQDAVLVADGVPCETDFAADAAGGELSVAEPWIHHDGGSTYTVRSGGVATSDNPGSDGFYRKQLAADLVDFYVRVTVKGFGTAAGTKLVLIGRDTGNCEVDFSGGVATINISCGSGSSASSVFYQIPTGDHTIEVRYVGTTFRVLLDGVEIFRGTLSGANGGAYPGFYGSAGISSMGMGTIAQVAAPGAPTAPTTLTVVPASSAVVGTPATGQVVLSGGPASSTDTPVALAETGATPATQTVVIPAGSLSAPFTYTPTATGQAFTPTATGLSGSGSIFTGSATQPVVTPTAPTTLALTPAPSSTVVGTAGGWVATLSGGPASASATTIALDYVDATGPASVTIPVGALSVAFSVVPTAAGYTVTPTATGLSGSGVAVNAAATAATPPPSSTAGLARLFRILRRAAS